MSYVKFKNGHVTCHLDAHITCRIKEKAMSPCQIQEKAMAPCQI